MTDEEREVIERMAGAGFTGEEIAEVLEVSVSLTEDEDFKKAFRKGYLTRQLELRERIFKDAKNGSSPAQAMAKKILDDCATKMGDDL